MSLLFLALPSCTPLQPSPTSNPYSEMRKITIVAVEAAPFNSAQGNGWVFLGPAYLPEEDADLSLISIAVSLFAEEFENKGAEVEAAPPSGAGRETWSPSLTLAREAATLISSASTCEAVVRNEQCRLPSSSRNHARSVFEDWYHRDNPALNAKELDQVGRFPVLELGLSDLSLVGDELLIQVLVKMVDPVSGAVRARSIGRTTVRVGSPEELFLYGGEKFKAVFAGAGRDLLEKNLQQMGILPR